MTQWAKTRFSRLMRICPLSDDEVVASDVPSRYLFSFSWSSVMELEELIETSFKLGPSIDVERPLNIPIPKTNPGENGDRDANHGDGESVGKVSESYHFTVARITKNTD